MALAILVSDKFNNRKRGKMKKGHFNKNIKNIVKQYGYLYPAKKYIAGYIGTAVLLALIMYIYNIGLIYALFVFGTLIIVFPALLNTHYMSLHRLRQFSDVDIYIHQMAYSFKRQPKINVALEDTKKVVSTKMATEIEKALKMLMYAETEKVYEDALKIIEKKYSCNRVITLHKFLINIEMKGGLYENSLDILITDFDRWVKRVYKYQIDIKRVRNNSVIGLFLSFILASVSILVNMVLSKNSQLNINITSEILYQITSTVFLILCILYFVYMQMQCNRNWLGENNEGKNIKKDYDMAFHTDVNKLFFKALPLYLFVGALALVVFFSKMYIAFFLIVLLLVFFLMVPQMNKKSAFRRLQKQVYQVFSDWLRDVSLNLSEEPLQVAIEDTYDNCNYMIKESLEKFIYGIEENPSDVKPYYDFLREYKVNDISSTVKTLYSLSSQESDFADNTINTLIERNYSLMDRYEYIKNKDTISVMKFAEYIPTFFVSFKVAIDLILVITNYL